MNILDDLVEASGNVYSSDFVENPVNYYIDTGSYTMNALLSGSIFGGAVGNRVTAFIGEPATGKSLFTLSIVRNFLKTNPTSGVIYFETEGALNPKEKETQDILNSLEIDMKRFKILSVETVQEFRTQAIRILDKYMESDEETRPKLMFCLDSLGNLSTNKEIEDALSAKEVSDMTRARMIKGVFRILTLKLSKAKVPMFVTNHTYTQIGVMFPQQIPSGGSGLIYSASAIVALSRKKDKDGTAVVGNIIHCKNFKNRLAVENKIIDTRVSYDKGINRYYGLVEIAVEAGIFKQLDKKIELPSGDKVWLKSINSEPEKYFTDDILKKIDEYTIKTFKYGKDVEIDKSKENDIDKNDEE